MQLDQHPITLSIYGGKMGGSADRLHTLVKANYILSGAMKGQFEAMRATAHIADVFRSDSLCFFTLSAVPDGEVPKIQQHSAFGVNDHVHNAYVEYYFRKDPILPPASSKLHNAGWAAYRLGDYGSKAESEDHEEFLEEFLFPAEIHHVMILSIKDRVDPNCIHLLGCHRRSKDKGFTHADLENASILAPAIQNCFWNRFSPATLQQKRNQAEKREENCIKQNLATGKFDHIRASLRLRQADLTLRECEVALLVIQGKRNLEIASILSVSHKTIENQLTSIYQKCGCVSRSELVLFAIT